MLRHLLDLSCGRDRLGHQPAVHGICALLPGHPPTMTRRLFPGLCFLAKEWLANEYGGLRRFAYLISKGII